MTTENSTEASTYASEEVYNLTTKPTGEATTKMSGNSTGTTEGTLEVTPTTMRSTQETSADSLATTGNSTLNSSQTLDNSLGATSGFDENTALDPNIADALIKQAYAFKGPLLDYFSRGLNIEQAKLARIIINNVPKKPLRSQLVKLLTYIVPEVNRRES